MNIFRKIWSWYYKRFVLETNSNVPISSLKWIKKDLKSGRKEPFSRVDSIKFDINKILTKDEIIIEVESKEKAKEIIEKCVVRI